MTKHINKVWQRLLKRIQHRKERIVTQRKNALRLPFYSLAVPLQMKAKIYSTSSSQRTFSFISQCCSKGRQLHNGEVSENTGQFSCDVREGWRCPDLPQASSVWPLGKERERRYDSAIKAVSAISCKRLSRGLLRIHCYKIS